MLVPLFPFCVKIIELELLPVRVVNDPVPAEMLDVALPVIFPDAVTWFNNRFPSPEFPSSIPFSSLMLGFANFLSPTQ